MALNHHAAETAGISTRRLRLASGIMLFIYISSHLPNHTLGLIGLNTKDHLGRSQG
jgi:hypothetical protein